MNELISTYNLVNDNGSPANFILKSAGDLYDHSKGKPDQLHRHNYYTILLLESAKGTHIIDFKTYELTNHSLFFIYPGQIHQLKTTSRPNGWIINFNDQFLIQNQIPEHMIADVYLFNQYGETPPLSVNAKDFENYKILIRQIEQYRHSHPNYKDEALGALLKLLLIQSNNNCDLKKNNNPQLVETGNHLVREFKRLIENHFHELHKVSDYAKILSITPDYLNKSVKAVTQKSAKEYILNRILLEAKRSLLFSKKTTKELAYDLGFEEPAHFSNFFKRYCGESPIEFKSRN